LLRPNETWWMKRTTVVNITIVVVVMLFVLWGAIRQL
jgi:hypothetical protein